MLRIALDAGGPAGARDLSGVWEGAIAAAGELDCEVLLFGPEGMDSAREKGSKRGPARDRVRLSPASDPLMSACAAASDGKAQALVSCSEPRAAVAAALSSLKRSRGVLKPALAARLRTRGGAALLLDAGASSDCKSWHLLQFALMGSSLARTALGVESPSVALLSSDAGDGKGGPLAAEAAPLLKYSGVRYAGLAEAGALISGGIDVLVCDGVLGAAALGFMEGMAVSCFEMLESAIASGALGGLAKRMLAGAMAEVRAKAPPPAKPGLALLGVDASAVVCRSREAGAIRSSLALAAGMARGQTKDHIRERVEDVKTSMDVARALE